MLPKQKPNHDKKQQLLRKKVTYLDNINLLCKNLRQQALSKITLKPQDSIYFQR